jgi:hypothetical protein
MHTSSIRTIACLLVCLLLSPGRGAAAAEPVGARGSQPVAESGETAPNQPAKAPGTQRLDTILQSIEAAKAERAETVKRLKAAPADIEAKELEADVARLTRRLEELRISLEESATGGLSIAGLEEGVELQPLDWKQEVEDVVRPLLHEIKRMTERPRMIERLRSEQAIYQDRLETANVALTRLAASLAQADSATLKTALTELKADWTSRREDVNSRLHLIEGQLERLLAPDAGAGDGVLAAIREFFAGRGLNALLALAGFAGTYVAFAAAGGAITRLAMRRSEPRARRLAKAGGLLWRVLSFVIALLTAMAVLSVRGDWLILGLLILALFGGLLSLRSSLPRYLDKVRVLLNLGGVREGERVIYQGIPWRIKSLNLYSTLHNPLLSGGTIRVPIDQMAALQSRQHVKEEPWFPSRESDFVILDGEVFGKVILQTPEVVQLQVVGATQSYAVADYLARHPRNLSLDGFAVPLSFGLDYRHQSEILTGVVNRMRDYVRERSRHQAFHPFMKELLVEFNEAASSSLNLIIVAAFEGAAAEHYWSIRRFLQQTAVDACNRFGWTIPFEQLTLHVQDGWTGDGAGGCLRRLTPGAG